MWKTNGGIVEKQYTVNEVLELQNQKKALEQRLAVHKQRLIEKQNELNNLFAQEGVKDFAELQQLCIKLNADMQNYAVEESKNIQIMKAACDELDRSL